METKVVPVRSYKTGENSWLIIGPSSLTTIELSDALGITDGSSGSGVLVRAENYYGRASKAIWEWVTAKMGESLDAAAK